MFVDRVKGKLKVAPMLAVVLVAIACIGTVTLAGFLVLQTVFGGLKSQAARVRNDLVTEFDKIPPPLGAERVQYSSLFKVSNGAVSGGYKTALSYNQIRSHYDVELAKLGWKFAGESDVIYNGVNYGGKQAFYCKNSYTADVQYAGGQNEQFGWTYSFGLSWRIHSECDQ